MGAAAPIAIIAATVISTAMQAMSQIQAGQAAAAQADYQAGVARNNQILAERAAKDALERGKIAEHRQQMATQQLIGRQRAVLASSGVKTDVGSALDITVDTAGIGELDALTIRSNAEREALGFRTQGMNFQAEAGLAKARGASALSAGYTGAFGTLLSSGGSVASKWYSFNDKGTNVIPSWWSSPTRLSPANRGA